MSAEHKTRVRSRSRERKITSPRHSEKSDIQPTREAIII